MNGKDAPVKESTDSKLDIHKSQLNHDATVIASKEYHTKLSITPETAKSRVPLVNTKEHEYITRIIKRVCVLFIYIPILFAL
jgi:hypothetical protein